MDNENKFIGKILNVDVSIEEIKYEFNTENIRILNYTMPIEFDIDWNRLNVIINENKTIVSLNFG